MSRKRVAVIGAGSWGTALAKLLGDKGHDVVLWAHRAEHVAEIAENGENRKYLPGARLKNIRVTAEIAEAINGCEAVLLVVPSHVTRDVLEKMRPLLGHETSLITATKGIENNTLLTMTQVMEDVLPEKYHDRLSILSGPSFAREVALELPTAVTVASNSKEEAISVQQLFYTDRFRVYASTDVRGLELGGALKNIIAIAAGISDGLGFGTNTRAALITRGLAEITRLGVRMGANPLTFSGLAGLGDLVLTSTGDLSRNRHVGVSLGKGKKLDEILAEMSMVAEGVKTAKSAYNLSKRERVEMPILEQVYQVLYEDRPCLEAVSALMTRDQKEELEYLSL